MSDIGSQEWRWYRDMRWHGDGVKKYSLSTRCGLRVNSADSSYGWTRYWQSTRSYDLKSSRLWGLRETSVAYDTRAEAAAASWARYQGLRMIAEAKEADD